MTYDEWQIRSWNAFPVGSLGEYNLPQEYSIILTHGIGSHVYDVTGREFIDLTMGWGSVMLGHAHPVVVEAVSKQMGLGSNFAYVTLPALQLAEEIIDAVPCAEKVRFCASGTEATMYAVRLARAATGRSKILKFEGAYHGANAVGTMSLFPQTLVDFPVPVPTSAGITESAQMDILIAPYNDLETTRRIVVDYRHELAGIIVEPLHRCTTPVPGFLAGLREIADEFDLLLIFDEVVTGFRLAYGGAQEYYGVVPDIAAYGKGLGGGYPLGAIAGRESIMDLVAEPHLNNLNQYVWFASSTGGNPVSAATSLATLNYMRQPHIYEEFFAIGAGLRSGLVSILTELGIEAQVLGDGPLCAVSFSDKPITDYRSAHRANSELQRRFLLGLFENGIFLNPNVHKVLRVVGTYSR